MTPSYPKRLIEVDLPIRRISEHARREKSIRHGHISTLHIGWARRPLAACRAVICAALWPDPADEQCPATFRDAARREMQSWMAANMKKVEEKLDELNGRLEQRTAEFRREAECMVGDIQHVGRAWVLPHPERNAPQIREMVTDPEIERIAVQFAIKKRENGDFRPEICRKDDLESCWSIPGVAGRRCVQAEAGGNQIRLARIGFKRRCHGGAGLSPAADPPDATSRRRGPERGRRYRRSDLPAPAPARFSPADRPVPHSTAPGNPRNRTATAGRSGPG